MVSTSNAYMCFLRFYVTEQIVMLKIRMFLFWVRDWTARSPLWKDLFCVSVCMVANVVMVVTVKNSASLISETTSVLLANLCLANMILGKICSFFFTVLIIIWTSTEKPSLSRWSRWKGVFLVSWQSKASCYMCSSHERFGFYAEIFRTVRVCVRAYNNRKSYFLYCFLLLKNEDGISYPVNYFAYYW